MPNNATLLIVDDDERNSRVLEAQLRAEGYRTLYASSGEAALEQLRTELPDLILLDVMMPGMSGFELAGRLKQDERTKNIPIIMVTALEDRESRLNALHHGAEEFLTKPVDRAELWVRVRNLLRLKEYRDLLADHNRLLEEQVAARTKELRDAYKDTIYTLVQAAEYKDEDTGSHIQRIGFYCLDLAEEMGKDPAFCDAIFHASPMHDVGKMAIPDAVLLKPGGLSDEEWRVMKGHPAFGALILARGASPYLKMGAEIALNHHERWNGGGYPNDRRGEEIPFAARLMTIADIYDALRMKRPYKPAFDHAKAVDIITRGDGRTQPEHFDPQVLAAFVRCAGRWNDIFEAHGDE